MAAAIFMKKNIIIKENQELFLPLLWTGNESQLSYDILLAGNGAKVTLLALLLGKDTSKLDLKINISHQKPGTKSRIIVKGLLDDNADINFNGLVKIEKGAKDTDTSLAAHILLLSDKAKVTVVPSLEIEENHIKAGHAATIGRINDLELFYLCSRGLSEKEAKSLIVQGFLESILHKFPDEIANEARNALFRRPTPFTSEQQ
jgi:Fe-S cluster assembly protein SufD